MPRRIHTSQVRAGDLTLSDREAHHARDVLRLAAGEVVEVFDDAGGIARGTIASCDARRVVVRVEEPAAAGEVAPVAIRLTIAAAVPKGDRADWMIEKLSELGVERFIPLAAARSVVLPEGKNKRERWTRIATEAAKQSRRRGVMRIDELAKVRDVLREAASNACWVLATTGEARSAIDLVARDLPPAATAFIGPEGGWTDDELAQFTAAGTTAVRLTPTILRVETAAIAVAAVVGSVSNPSS